MFDQTRQELKAFMDESRKSQSQIAKETGISTSVISQFLRDNYPGDNDEIARALQRYLTVGKERLNTLSRTRFYPQLYNTQEVLFTCNYAHRKNDITLVSGDAGAGKTTALRHYEDTNTGVIFVTANACTRSATAVLSLVCERIGKQVPGRRATLMQTLVELLAGSSRLIIIDEADHLSFDALQAIRNLNDLAHVGIVLSGNDKIYRQMLSGRRSYEFDQLRTRIVIRKKIFNSFRIEEMEAMFPGLDADCIRFLMKLAHAESLRTANKLFEAAAELAAAQSQPLTVRHLKETQNQLFGEAIAS